MPLKQMRHFAAVIDCASFTGAAERCCTSQSAISRQIRALERAPGGLIRRGTGGSLRLAPGGPAPPMRWPALPNLW